MKLYFVAITIALLSSLVFAQEATRYNFASLQSGNILSIPQGRTGIGNIYFYNVDGNRITHIALEIVESPDNWNISIEPELHTATYNISGLIVEIDENVFVEPSFLSDKPLDESYIQIGDRGYAPAKAVDIIVKIPADEIPGKKEKIVVRTNAQWLGQTGAAALGQSRDFTYTVNVLAAGEEVPLVQENITESQIIEKKEEQPITGLIFANPVTTSIIAILILIIIFLIVVISRKSAGSKLKRRAV